MAKTVDPAEQEFVVIEAGEAMKVVEERAAKGRNFGVYMTPAERAELDSEVAAAGPAVNFNLVVRRAIMERVRRMRAARVKRERASLADKERRRIEEDRAAVRIARGGKRGAK